MDKEILKKLDERLAKGEISEELYKEIKARYEGKDEEVEDEEIEGLEEEVELEIEEEKKEGKSKEKKQKRVSISGVSRIEGCNCETFRAAGASKVEGDLRADDADISGATKVSGNAYLGTLDSSGSFKIDGNTEARSLDLSGATKFGGKVKADKIDSSGSTKFQGDVEAKDFDGSGSFKAESNITSDTFKASGSFKINGTLKGEEIQLNPAGSCKISKIKGGDIIVEAGSSGIFSFSFGGSGSLTCDEIIGNDIYLENTKCELIEGNKVKIGPGCKVDTVRAKKLKVHESASVKNKEKIE
ncbi:MAG: hypothetical protein ACOC5D_04055 [Thermoplasmatota archaeon]